MYRIGSKVVHPCHGAGTIVQIAAKRIGSIEHNYYIVRLCQDRHSTDIMVPVKRADEMGLRPVGPLAALRQALVECSQPPAKVHDDYRQRKVWAAELLKSGSFERVIEMVRCLTLRHSQKPLGMGERDTLSDGKEMLATELALASGQELDEALAEVEDQLSQMAASEEPA